MQLAETTSNLPNDLLQVRKENRDMRLGKTAPVSSQQVTETAQAKGRTRKMTDRMEDFSARLSNVRRCYRRK